MISRRNVALALAALPLGLTRDARAADQAYPTRPVRLVVPFPAGGSTDVGARLIADNLSRAFGQQVFVETNPAPMARSAWPKLPRVRPTATAFS